MNTLSSIDIRFDSTKTYGDCRDVGYVLLTKTDIQVAQAPLIAGVCALIPLSHRHRVRWIHQLNPMNYHRDSPCVNRVGWVYEGERPR